MFDTVHFSPSSHFYLCLFHSFPPPLDFSAYFFFLYGPRLYSVVQKPILTTLFFLTVDIPSYMNLNIMRAFQTRELSLLPKFPGQSFHGYSAGLDKADDATVIEDLLFRYYTFEQ